MSKPIQLKTATLLVENLISSKLSLAAAGRRFILVLTALVWFAHSPSTRAVSPAPDGGYSNHNTAEGDDALFSLTTGNDNAAVGNQGVAGESNTIRIGTAGTQTNAFMAGIFEVVVTKSQPVYVDIKGHLGTKPSSERFKTDIKPMDKASEAILALKPITFRYKKELDPDAVPQFVLVADDVAKGDPNLVLRDGNGKNYSVRYDAVTSMLL